MPFVSAKQKKWAFATHQPWASEWADKTKKHGGFKGRAMAHAHKRKKKRYYS